MILFTKPPKKTAFLCSFLLVFLLGTLLLTPGCGKTQEDVRGESGVADLPSLADSASFDGNWLPLSANASENAMEIKGGKVTWYVRSADGTRFLPMEEYRKNLLAENESIERAEFSATLVGDALSMVLTVTSTDGQVKTDPVVGRLSRSGDVLTLTLAGGLAGGSANLVEFTRSPSPVADYRGDERGRA